MSSAVGQADFGVMATLISNAATVRQKLDNLTNQASTGLIGATYASLGTGATVSLNLNPQVANLQAWQNNIDSATGRMGVTQTAMTDIQSIAANFFAQLNNLNGVDASTVDSVAASARQALGQVAGQLDTLDGGVYVFAGQDSGNPPVPNPDDFTNLTINPTGFFAQINAAVGTLSLSTNNAAAIATTTLGIGGSNLAGTSPFSAYLSQASTALQPLAPAIQVGQNLTASVALLASTNTLIPDTVTGPPAIAGGPATTTGSYTRDILRALATIASLSSSQINAPGFQDLIQDTRTSLSGAITSMATDAGVLGDTQRLLATTQTQLADTATAVTLQISSAQDVDMASILSQITLVQTQMQSSYQLIAGMSGLSLVKFLPAG